MRIWEERQGAARLIFADDERTGMQAVVAIDSTKLGPALGGCRWMSYGSEDDAIADALRLARGMTYKNAMAGLPYGGGKAVLYAPQPNSQVGVRGAAAEAAAFRALGRLVDSLRGAYITGMDLGTSVREMDWIRTETPYVTDTTGSLGADGEFTAEMTAYGVYLGIRAALKRAFGDDSPAGRTIAVQGLGKVGLALCRHLAAAGAELIVADVRAHRVREAIAAFRGRTRATSPADIVRAACDVFAPCALGGVLGDDAASRLRCRIVAGAANNQLVSPRGGERMHEAGVLYAPDYVINAGGIIVTAVELAGGDAAEAKRCVERIPAALDAVFDMAAREKLSPSAAADRLAERRLAGTQP
ncbi:NAD(P)-binding domain-containing protein [Paenibacillus sp. TRM 82003]|nr:NAD(P)-binding domain-containing protein [Paenibacillus sp. TRM 82003]